MGLPATSLKKVLDHLDISNAALAKALSIDPSLVSRWLNGHRQIKLASDTLDKLTDYLMRRIQHSNRADWLKRQMEHDGIKNNYNSINEFQKDFKVWLSSDGDSISRILDFNHRAESIKPGSAAASNTQMKTGFEEIALFLKGALEKLPANSKIDIHLSSEDISLLLQESISQTIFESMLEKMLQVRLIISMANNTTAMSRLLSQYLQAIVEGLLSISVVHSMTQAITNQSTLIIGDNLVLIVSETPKSLAPPIGMPVYEKSFVRETKKSFERMFNYSQPLYQRYNDGFSRNIIEILYHEYAAPGNLDVIKDSINPLCMSQEEYDRALKSFGDDDAQFQWRSDEAARFKSSMVNNFNNGTVFREILSLNRLRQIAEEGNCKMPSLYFMYAGITYLDARGCLSAIEGYINFLKQSPNFHVIILDEMPIINENCCWHLKQNMDISLNGWTKDEHIILYSNQLALTHEFQMIYNDLWDKENYSSGMRKKTIQTLQDIAEQLKRNHNLSIKAAV